MNIMTPEKLLENNSNKRMFACTGSKKQKRKKKHKTEREESVQNDIHIRRKQRCVRKNLMTPVSRILIAALAFSAFMKVTKGHTL